MFGANKSIVKRFLNGGIPMKMLMLALILISTAAFAGEGVDIQAAIQKGDCAGQAESVQWLDAQNQLQPASTVSALSNTANAERRGCCSHHGGVCGCDGATGMQLCCDGTDSPSCECE